MAFSPDGKILLTGSMDGTAKLWELATRQEVRSLEHPPRIFSVAFSPDGKTVATGGGGENAAVRLWDARTGELLRTLAPSRSSTSFFGREIAFSPDGKLIAVADGSDNTVKVWKMEAK